MKRKKPTRLPPPPTVNPQTWQALFEAADEYVEAEPWLNMGDAEAFGVYDRTLGRTGWGVALGQMQESFGLAFYQEREGLAQFQEIVATHGELFRSDYDFLATQNMLNFNWVPKNELHPHDLDIIKSVGWPTSGEERYYQFYSYRPGYLPWPLDENEARFMLRGLEAGMLMAEKVSVFKTIPPGMMPMWIFENDDWKLAIVKPDPWEPPPLERAVLLESSLAHFQKKNIVQKGTWEAGHFYLRGQVMDMERPYHMHIVALVDSESTYALPPQAMRPTDNVAEVLHNVLVGAIEKENVIPIEMAFSDQRLMQAISPVLEKLGIKAVFKPSLPAFDVLKQEMREHFPK
jgi:hypothetical protein